MFDGVVFHDVVAAGADALDDIEGQGVLVHRNAVQYPVNHTYDLVVDDVLFVRDGVAGVHHAGGQVDHVRPAHCHHQIGESLFDARLDIRSLGLGNGAGGVDGEFIVLRQLDRGGVHYPHFRRAHGVFHGAEVHCGGHGTVEDLGPGGEYLGDGHARQRLGVHLRQGPGQGGGSGGARDGCRPAGHGYAVGAAELEYVQCVGLEAQGAYGVGDHGEEGALPELLLTPGHEARQLQHLPYALRVAAATHNVLSGVVEGVEKVVQVVVLRPQVMGLAGDEVETDVLQVVYQGGGADDVPEHGGTVASGAHIEDAEHAAAVGEMYLALPQGYVVSPVPRVEGEAMGVSPQYLVQPLPGEASPLLVVIDLGTGLLQYVQIGAIGDFDPNALQYQSTCPVYLVQAFRRQRPE